MRQVYSEADIQQQIADLKTLVYALKAAFADHVHAGVTAGPGISGPPTVELDSATLDRLLDILIARR